MCGSGETLAFRLHDMCFRLQRYCYIQLYDSAYEQYFTYANRDRWTWQGSRKELKPYGSQKRIALNCTLEQRWEPYVERVLFPALGSNVSPARRHLCSRADRCSMRRLRPRSLRHLGWTLQTTSAGVARGVLDPGARCLHGG